MKINLVIPAAGLGSRFRVSGENTPKPLIPILGVPMIGWVISNFRLQSTDEVWVISRKEDGLPAKLQSFTKNLTTKFNFIELDELTDGPATTLQIALNEIKKNEGVICANSDQYISTSIMNFVDETRNGTSLGQILTMNATGSKWSYVQRDPADTIIKVIEKVEVSNEATVGVYGWKTADIALEAIENMKAKEQKVNNEYYVAPSYNFLIENHYEVYTSNIGQVERDVHGLGTPEDLEIFLRNSNIKGFRDQVIGNLGLVEDD